MHEWWIQLRDDLMLAGTLFNCCPETSSAGLSHVENKKFDRAKDALLAGDLPDTPREIIYGIWFEPQHDYRATVGPIRNNLWLTPLRFTSRRASVLGHIRILRLLKPGDPRTAFDAGQQLRLGCPPAAAVVAHTGEEIADRRIAL